MFLLKECWFANEMKANILGGWLLLAREAANEGGSSIYINTIVHT